MLEIERLNRDILRVHRDPSLSETARGNAIRALVASRRGQSFTTGASVHYYTGQPHYNGRAPESDPLAIISDMRVAVARRIHHGKHDGIAGSAGGLAKRLSSARLDGAYQDEALLIAHFGKDLITHADLDAAIAAGNITAPVRDALVNVFDDVVADAATHIAYTNDPAIILDKNIRREAREELGNRAYRLMKPTIDAHGFEIVMSGLVDDRYVCTPAWWADAFEKQGLFAYPCSATTTMLKVDGTTFDTLIALTENAQSGDGEVTGLSALPLSDALTRLSCNNIAGPGYRADFHYRYLHEGLVPWRMASDALGGDPSLLVALTKKIAARYAPENRLDFARVATQLGMTLDDFDRQFNVQRGTFAKMQKAATGKRTAPPHPHP